MSNPTLVNGTDINQWSDRRDSQEMLPRLVRRLTEGTVDNIKRIGFPADEGVQLSGWDGVVSVEEGNQYVPHGFSVWEMGTNKEPKAKADDDYTKRTSNAGDVVPSETTFVFITSRRWGGKSDWVEKRKAEGIWKDVRAYDADDLAAWLELAPAVHLWLSIVLGKRQDGIDDLGSWWRNWTESTRPPLSSQLLIAGRQEAVTSISDWLKGKPSVLGLVANSREEAIAFFSAVVYSLSAEERGKLLARSIVSTNKYALQAVSASASPLILIPDFDDFDNIHALERLGHHVLVPLGQDGKVSQGVLELPKLRFKETSDAFESMGFSPDKARSLAGLARRSLLSLRRSLAISPAIQRPKWAMPAEATLLLPAVLAGTWQDDRTGDRDFLEKITGRPYEELSNVLVRWEHEPDPPARRTGNIWALSAKDDAWRQIASLATRDQLNAFESLAVEVLQEVDPAFDLPPDQRILTSLKKMELSRSYTLRSGIVDTLAIAAGLSEIVKFGDGSSGQDLANRVVCKVLHRDSMDWRAWASLDTLLPLLAEASPDQFLSALEHTLATNSDQLHHLMSDERIGQLGSSLHTGLLWGLENLAWNPDNLSRVSIALAKLAMLDPTPNSNRLNRPLRSLQTIFLSWLPQTAAPLERRMRVLDTLRRREPDVAWNLMVDMLPRYHATAHPAHRPTYRDWVPDNAGTVSFVELGDTTALVIGRLLEDAGTNYERWNMLLDALNHIPTDQQELVVKRLASLNFEMLTSEERTSLRDALRNMISKNRDFQDAEWALSTKIVDRLEELYNGIASSGDVEQEYAWLFTGSPDILGVSRRDYEKWWTAIALQREAAVKDIYQAKRLSGVLSFASKSDYQSAIGSLLARAGITEQDEELLLSEDFVCLDCSYRNIVVGYIMSLASDADWVESKISVASSLWSEAQTVGFLTALPFELRTWNYATALGSEVEKRYWSLVQPGRPADAQSCLAAINKLTEAERPYVALDLVSQNTQSELPLSIEHLAELIERLFVAKVPDKIDWSYFAWQLGELLDLLDRSGKIDNQRLAQMEWVFLGLLDHRRPPKSLSRELANSPARFLEVLRLLYKADGDERQSISEEDKARAHRAWDLLEAWSHIPGAKESGIDKEHLMSWISEVRDGAQQEGRLSVAENHIGHVLAHSPIGSDGYWPTEQIRDVIEELANPHIESGFANQVHNGRGVTWRSPYDGGTQERELANKYQSHADTFADTWPRTAAIVRRIAESYYREADDEDKRASFGEDFGR